MDNYGELSFQNAVNCLPLDVHLASKSCAGDYGSDGIIKNDENNTDFKMTMTNLDVENATSIGVTEVSMGDVIVQQDVTSLDPTSFLYTTNSETAIPLVPQSTSLSIKDHENGSGSILVHELSSLHILDSQDNIEPITLQVLQNSSAVTPMIDPVTALAEINCTQLSTANSTAKTFTVEVKGKTKDVLIHVAKKVNETKVKREVDNAIGNILNSVHSSVESEPALMKQPKTPVSNATIEEVTLKANHTKKNKEKVAQKHQCNICGKTFREKSHLATHSRAHVDVRNFSCGICGGRFKTRANLYFHTQTHSEAPFTCTECNKTFAERKILKRHIRVVHSCKELHKCNQCDKTFKSAAILSLHYTLHTGTKPFRCSMCPKSFVYKSALAMHISQNHQCTSCLPSSCRHRARSWLCPVCGKGYSLKATLSNHMKTHDPDKLYKCSECPKTFVKKHSYEVHVKLHTGEGPQFMCDQCTRSYFNVFALRRHYLKHTSQRNFICEICTKAFWMKDALKVHMRSHSNEKPFQCQRCPKAFGHKHTLESHMKTHRSDQDDSATVMIPTTSLTTAEEAPTALTAIPITSVSAATSEAIVVSNGATTIQHTAIPAHSFLWYQLPPPLQPATHIVLTHGDQTAAPTLHVL